MISFGKNGTHNGKTAYLVYKRTGAAQITFASIFYDQGEWALKRTGSGRTDRFETVRAAKEEAMKG